MFIVNPVTKVLGPPIWQIGTDGGYLDAPVKVDPSTKLLLMPGERAGCNAQRQPVKGAVILLKT